MNMIFRFCSVFMFLLVCFKCYADQEIKDYSDFRFVIDKSKFNLVKQAYSSVVDGGPKPFVPDDNIKKPDDVWPFFHLKSLFYLNNQNWSIKVNDTRYTNNNMPSDIGLNVLSINENSVLFEITKTDLTKKKIAEIQEDPILLAKYLDKRSNVFIKKDSNSLLFRVKIGECFYLKTAVIDEKCKQVLIDGIKDDSSGKGKKRKPANLKMMIYAE